jgi:hypothetical protein
VIYGDGFDCAVTLDEIWRYARIAVGRDDLRRRIEMDPILGGVVTHRDGLYCLAGRAPLLAERPGRIARAAGAIEVEVRPSGRIRKLNAPFP